MVRQSPRAVEGARPYGVYPRSVRGKGFPLRSISPVSGGKCRLRRQKGGRLRRGGSWLPEGQTDEVVAERRIFTDNPKAFGNTSSASFHSSPSPLGEGLILPLPWCGVVGRKGETARQRTVGRFSAKERCVEEYRQSKE